MKKENIILILVVFLMLILPINVFAKISYENGLQCTGENPQNCKMGFTVSDKPINKNNIKVTLVLKNMTLKDFKVSEGYYLISSSSQAGDNGETTYTYEFGSDTLSKEVNYHEMATLTLEKVQSASDCSSSYQGQHADNFSCQRVEHNGEKTYYAQSGEKVELEAYIKECATTTCDKSCVDDTCIYFDNNKAPVQSEHEMKVACHKYNCEKAEEHYYDNSGNEVDITNYIKACRTNTCDKTCIDSTCVYFDNNSQPVDEHNMNVACKLYKCEIVNNEYFDNSGNKVTWTEYQKACESNKYTCEKVCNPNNSRECLYYDKDKNSVSEHEMNVSCKNYSCQKVDNQYYDKDGNPVKWEEYDKQCNTYSCQKVCNPSDNKTCLYYNASDEVVSWQDYEKSCGKYSCNKICEPGNNKTCLYFDKEGKPVSGEQEMKKSCDKIEQVYKCEIVNDKYYDKDGKSVTWKEYELSCHTNTCQKVCDPANDKDCLYYDKLGAVNTELQYSLECLPHVCEKVGDLYYFDKNGDLVDNESQMLTSCEEKNSCELVNGKYFDKEGNITNKEGYQIACFPHSCEKIGNTFFDKEGNIVNADKYDASCNPPIENPQTGTIILSIIGIAIIFGSGIVVYKKLQKQNKFI